ncbi:DUF664 domain-containing protein [Deinococcus yavapaiensis]|uniref:Uncharacterized protein DUF664 n=1 Tax=Deinococcus yavapaiensis KR-236 TaxID=694435 RepID=A0A318SAA8_9DEIO|nr:DUF664 domain-containing protein [Deinococcus yavapaiensis]PYE55000.1 uncharacterized protein DUF664 [Deinococcus yavapaiensis KR-236]
MRELVVSHRHPVPEIGAALWTLEEARRRTHESVTGLFDPDVAPAGLNAIGTLLYHIAAIELDWLFTEVRQEDFPDEAARWFPVDVRDEAGRLSAVVGETVQHHLDRLGWVRALLLDTFEHMTVDDFVRPRSLPRYDVTPQWVLAHLALHESNHKGQILTLRTLQGRAVRRD